MTKLWLVKRTDRVGYDEYDSFVVACDTQEEARFTHPNNLIWSSIKDNWTYANAPDYVMMFSSWASPLSVSVQYLGTTDRDIQGVVLASFNAG